MVVSVKSNSVQKSPPWCKCAEVGIVSVKSASPKENRTSSAMYYSRVHGTLLDSIVFSHSTLPGARRWDGLRLHLMALPAVFLPQKRHGHTRLRQLPVDVRIVRLHIPAPALILAGKQDLLQLCVGDVIIQRPRDLILLCCLQNAADGVP